MSKRDLIVLGVRPNEFLVRAEGDAAAVREALARMLPDAQFQLEPISDHTATRMESRLSQAQLTLARKFNNEAGVRRSSALSTYRMSFAAPSSGVVATATATGKLKFSPNIAEVRKPLGGGIGPVGVTVGVGIAGKF
jgi:hypothetical protein